MDVSDAVDFLLKSVQAETSALEEAREVSISIDVGLSYAPSEARSSASHGFNLSSLDTLLASAFDGTHTSAQEGSEVEHSSSVENLDASNQQKSLLDSCNDSVAVAKEERQEKIAKERMLCEEKQQTRSSVATQEQISQLYELAQQKMAEQHEMLQRILSEKHDLASAYRRLQAAYNSAQRLDAAQASAGGAARDAGLASIDVDSVGAEISDAAAAAVDSALAVLGREDRAEHAGLVQELRRAQLEIAELRAAHASSPTRGARAAGWIGQASPAHGEMASPGTASEVARLHEALEQARQAHAEELRVCEAEQLARVAAEQTLSEREAATKSMLAARDGELARMHEQIVRLHEQLDSAHVAYVAAQTAANENARGAGGTLVASAVSRDACVMMGEASSAGCAWRGHWVCAFLVLAGRPSCFCSF